MYQDSNMLASIRKVEAAREENAKLDPRRMTAEEKETLLRKFHPDYRAEQFTELRFGPNQGQKVPLELAELLEGESRILHETFDLTKPDYETDVLIIGGGGAGCSAAIEADNAGAKVMVVTKLRMGDANTMMAEGGIQAADKPNDSPAQHFLDAYGGGHFAAQKDLLYKLVMDAPAARPASVCTQPRTIPAPRSCARCATKSSTAAFPSLTLPPPSNSSRMKTAIAQARCF